MDPVTGAAGTDVRSLAAELGISTKEAIALCTVAGVPVKSPESSLTVEQAARARAVLEGRAPMVVGPPKPQANRALLLVLAIGAAVVVAGGIGLAALGSALGEEPSIGVSPGQCFDEPGLLGAQLKPKPCDEPHDYRAEVVLDLTEVYDDEYPGWDELSRRAEERCTALGAGEITNSLMGPTVQFVYFGPRDQATWDSPAARKIVCAVPDGDE
jgi:hypothetical protein